MMLKYHTYSILVYVR